MSKLGQFLASEQRAASRRGLLSRLKWWAFGLFARLNQQRGTPVPALELPAGPGGQASVWVFASTIGELNAIEPFVGQVRRSAPKLALVLISDHPHYRDSFLSRYPDAAVCITLGHVDDAQRLATVRPPRLLVVAEIPCLPFEAPCRVSSGFVFTAKAHGALACIVNGWLYRAPPSCRMDALEQRGFARDFMQCFDAVGVQTAEIRDELVAAGAPAERIAITGNLKFDAMGRVDWRPEQARSAALLTHLMGLGRPIIVGGCVTSFEEQGLVLDAFVLLRQRLPDALLVLAPRHPEMADRMHKLDEFLEARQLRRQLKTQLSHDRIDPQLDCLVINVVGELRDFYAVASVAHVGVNHNALEPLAFAKPVTVIPGWLPEFASYSVYRLLMQEACLIEATSSQALAQAWHAALAPEPGRAMAADHIRSALAHCRGATARNVDLLERAIPDRRQAQPSTAA